MSVKQWMAVLLILLTCKTGIAQTSAYALVIGNNAPPVGHEETLSQLRYADDDAIRYFWFFRQVTEALCLLTVPDERTQKRYPNIAALAWPPTFDNLDKATEELAERIAADRRAGKKTAVYIAFSGHGAVTDAGDPFLALSNGALTQETFFSRILDKLEADYQHVFIDACYAEGVVGMRGIFGRERNGQTVALTEGEMALATRPRMDDFPGLGAIVSSTATEESHEWSRIESGVFTHELLSGLAGSADVNRDSKIEYSEIAAFIAAANREVVDLRGKLNVVARPPRRNQNVPLVDLREMDQVAFLTGDPSELGHFFIELQNGERYLDANLGGVSRVQIAVPLRSKAYLRTEEGEAELLAGAGNAIELDDLEIKRRQVHRRGSVAFALKKGFFATAYGPTYYKGFVDASDLVSVRFDLPPADLYLRGSAKVFPYQKPLAVANVAVAGVSLVAAAVFASLAMQARYEFNNTKLERPSHEAAQRYERYGTAAWLTAAVVPLTGVAAWLLWPDEPPDVSIRAGAAPADSSEWSGEVSFSRRF